MHRKDDKFGSQLYFPVQCFLFPVQTTQELLLLANMRIHNLRIISYLSLTMCNRKIVDTITAMQNN